MIAELHVSWSATQAGQLLASGAWADAEDSVARLGNRLKQAADIIYSWVMQQSGHVIMDATMTGAFKVPSDRIHGLGRIIEQVSAYVETDYHFGIGIGIKESAEALKQAYRSSEPYAFFDEAAGADPKDEDDPRSLDTSLHDDPLQKRVDQLPGGRADKKSPEDFDPAMLAAGTAHELEHTKDRQLAEEIAMDHLSEDPSYYIKLKAIEKFENDGNDHWMPADKGENEAQADGGPQNPSGVAKPDASSPPASPNEGASPAGETSENSESSESSEDSGQQSGQGGPQEGDDPMTMVAKALLKIKEQAAAIHTLKDRNPEAFEAVRNLVQAMVQLGHQVKDSAEGPPKEEPEGGEKTEKAEPVGVFKALKAPKLGTKRAAHMTYPNALPSPASVAGTVKDGKIKVAPVDPANGAPREQGWNQARAGMIVGPKGSAVSSREPNGE